MGSQQHSKILDGIEDLDIKSGECMFAGSLAACMKYMGEDVTYDYVMGVSGGAFRLLWHPYWCASNSDVLLLGAEPARRAFAALGYGYEFLLDYGRTDPANSREALRRRIVDSIGRDRPVIAVGVVGPPLCGVVTGYEDDGDVLLGRSYFHDGAADYYRKTDWYKGCHGLILIGEKHDPPARRDVLRDALRWALSLAHRPKREGRVSGLAAYSAWTDALNRDEEFPYEELESLTLQCHVSTSVTLAALCDARRSAASFLRTMADVDNVCTERLREAADAYEKESHVLEDAIKLAPFSWATEGPRPGASDLSLRRKLGAMITDAREFDVQAVSHLEKAHDHLSGKSERP